MSTESEIPMTVFGLPALGLILLPYLLAVIVNGLYPVMSWRIWENNNSYYWPGKKLQENIWKVVSTIVLILMLTVFVFYFNTKFRLNYPFWAIPFTLVLIDFASYLFHLFCHRTGPFWKFHCHLHRSFEEMKADKFVLTQPEIIAGFLPIVFRSLLSFFLRLPIEGLVIFEVLFAVVNIYNFGLKIALFGSESFLTRLFNRLFVSQVRAQAHIYGKGLEKNKNFGQVIPYWDSFFGTDLESR